MNQCIKCGRNIPDGELFCRQCSQSPVIAELNDAPVRRPAPPQRPAPKAAPRPVQKNAKASGRKGAVICLSIALAVTLGLLIFQQAGLQVEKNRARTTREEAQRQIAQLEETQALLEETQALLEQTEQQLKDKEQEIKTLSAQLADSKSSQNQGQYDLSTMEKELESLQTEYDAIKEEHDLMVQAVEAASRYKDKAEFLDKYVVFVVNNGTRLYHTYDCENFSGSNFWTYSPKLAQAQGFSACPNCIQ